MEARELFKNITVNKLFINTDFILFLNKHDIFKQKLKKGMFKTHIKSYEGDPKSVNDTTKYIENVFRKVSNVLKIFRTSKKNIFRLSKMIQMLRTK